MKKPTVAQIRMTIPLTESAGRRADPMATCNVCGVPSDMLGAWREHDEHDRPIHGPRALVFLAKDHEACRTKLDAHPRLYAEDAGAPGAFPGLCGPCANRRVFLACVHPDLKANGGAGLKVTLGRLPVIICGRGGCRTPLAAAVHCAGFTARAGEPLAPPKTLASLTAADAKNKGVG